MKTFLLALLLLTVISAQPLTNVFTLSFRYAARQAGDLLESKAIVLWNSQIVLSINPTDFNVHTASLEVTAVVGQNLLAFEAAGHQNTLALDFTNVKLIRVGDPTNYNIVVNGDFNQGISAGNYRFVANSINGWIGYPLIQIGYGPIYNNGWTSSDFICELSANIDYQIIQKITFDDNFNHISNIVNLPSTQCITSPTLGPFTLQFDWAATTQNGASLGTSQGNVVFNNFIIDVLIPSNSQVKHASYQVHPNACIINQLQFDGTSFSDGVGLLIANVKFYSSTSGNSAPTFHNGNFELGTAGWQVAQGSVVDCATYNSHFSSGKCIALDTVGNQRYTQNIPILASNVGYDIVGPLTTTAFGCLLNLNPSQGKNSYVYVRADSHSPGIVNQYASQTLINAQAAGLSTSIYLKLCRQADPVQQVASILSQIDSSLYSVLWLKAEPNDAPGCGWEGFSHQDNCAFLTAALRVPLQNGILPGVFSTPRIWQQYFGSTCDSIGQSGNYLLWYATYKHDGHVNSTVSYTDYSIFAGFVKPDQKQTAGNQTVHLCNNENWHAYIDFAYQDEWTV